MSVLSKTVLLTLLLCVLPVLSDLVGVLLLLPREWQYQHFPEEENEREGSNTCLLFIFPRKSSWGEVLILSSPPYHCFPMFPEAACLLVAARLPVKSFPICCHSPESHISVCLDLPLRWGILDTSLLPLQLQSSSALRPIMYFGVYIFSVFHITSFVFSMYPNAFSKPAALLWPHL